MGRPLDTTEHPSREAPKAAVGFYMVTQATAQEAEKAWAATQRCLQYFTWLHQQTLEAGTSTITIWSHDEPQDAVNVSEDGTTFVLVGSPMNQVSWAEAIGKLSKQGDDGFELPWEGRCVLLRISPDGRDWTIWNDWAGAIPVFHAPLRDGGVVSSIEPVVVEGADFSAEDLLPRGMVELLVHGHFLGTDTLYKGMYTLPADSVSRWRNGRFIGSQILWTVEPSDSRWEQGWEELAEEMYHHTYQAIASTLKHNDHWILPLSGGMDSRLIACVGADEGINLEAYTYGPAAWNEPIWARQVAKALGIPWRRVDVGVDYLSDHTIMWFDWFGSSLHAHGMYQMPLLTACLEQPGMIPDGFYGNNLAGGDHPSSVLLASEDGGWQGFYEGYFTHWQLPELSGLLSFDPAPALAEMADMIETQLSLVSHWPFYHQWNAVDMWNRQQRFIFYQPVMYDYFKGGACPFLDRTYARFCMSLPRLALEGRRLQKQMLKQYWPQVAKVSSTFSAVPPVKLSKKWLLRAGIASLLPRRLRFGPLREFGACPNTMELDCARAHGWEALYPLSPQFDGDDLFNAELVLQTAHHAIRDYDNTAYNKIRALQTLVYRLMNHRGTNRGS